MTRNEPATDLQLKMVSFKLHKLGLPTTLPEGASSCPSPLSLSHGQTTALINRLSERWNQWSNGSPCDVAWLVKQIEAVIEDVPSAEVEALEREREAQEATERKVEDTKRLV